MKRRFKHVYGPVYSWRLGRSLGVDPVYDGKSKVCSFDCVYCQVGRMKAAASKRKIFVKTDDIIREIRSLPQLKIDYITFSGAGEPTLAKNLGKIIKEIRKIRTEKIAVLTNSTLLARNDVRSDLAGADLVAVKLDAHSEGLFKKINKPPRGIKLGNVLKGIKKFRSDFNGKFALQVMFTPVNIKYAPNIAAIARDIKPDLVYINTPLRFCTTKALAKRELQKVRKYFEGMKITTVYEVKK